MVLSPTSQHSRPRHGDLAKSLILPQQDSTRIEMPEDLLSPKKDTVNRNIGKRSHRTSEYNIE